MRCPACEGRKGGHGIGLVRRQDGSEMTCQSEAIWRDCDACNGAGEISPERWAEFQEWRRIGATMRADREGRDRSLREEARDRGLSVVTLSDMERGRVKPEPRQEVGG